MFTLNSQVFSNIFCTMAAQKFKQWDKLHAKMKTLSKDRPNFCMIMGHVENNLNPN